MLKNKFIIPSEKFSHNDNLIKKLWNEIILAHLSSQRYYHTLTHLKHIFEEFQDISLDKKEKNIIIFTTFYHDIIYDVSKSDNEIKSAILAKKRLLELEVPMTIIKQVVELILLTKTHHTTNNLCYQYFLDADLSILGTTPENYQKYTQQIRKEYQIYDDRSYKKGRTQVLEIFLKKKRLFQNDFFYEKYEKNAQKNIQNELLQLK